MGAKDRAKTKKAPTLEETFTAIVRGAISLAEQVECSLEDFADGLDTMVDELRKRASLVQDELKAEKTEPLWVSSNLGKRRKSDLSCRQ